jgi:prevent-host-death family protein
MAEYQIGATELRQKLTDIIQAVREENATYVVETFGRPQVAIIGLDEYRRLQDFRRMALDDQIETAKAAFGMWVDRDDIDDEWLKRNRRRWYSAWTDAAAKRDADNG